METAHQYHNNCVTGLEQSGSSGITGITICKWKQITQANTGSIQTQGNQE